MGSRQPASVVGKQRGAIRSGVTLGRNLATVSRSIQVGKQRGAIGVTLGRNLATVSRFQVGKQGGAIGVTLGRNLATVSRSIQVGKQRGAIGLTLGRNLATVSQFQVGQQRGAIGVTLGRNLTTVLRFQDWLDIVFGIAEGVDFIAISFVKSAEIINHLKTYIAARARGRISKRCMHKKSPFD